MFITLFALSLAYSLSTEARAAEYPKMEAAVATCLELLPYLRREFCLRLVSWFPQDDRRSFHVGCPSQG